MGAFFSRRRPDWIPPNEKLDEFCSKANSWNTEESLRGWKIGKDGAKFADALAKDSTVGSLDLSYNGLGDHEATKIGEAIRKNTQLKKLNLSNNHIHEDGAEGLAAAFKPKEGARQGVDDACNTTLTTLNLRNNSIGREGAVAIAEICGSESLVDINLYWNNIGLRGILAVVEALRGKDPKKFRKCDLRYNLIQHDPDEDDVELVGDLRKALAESPVSGQIHVDPHYRKGGD